MTPVKESLGHRMKEQYESRTKYVLPRRTYTLIRLDGKAFRTYTRDLIKPFDTDFNDAMNYGALKLCEHLQGVVFAYVQSDEISLLLTDFEKTSTAAWYDGAIQKMTSVSASVLTAYFNAIRKEQGIDELAFFDARAFTIPDRIEVENYFVWRQKDAIRNSISMAASANFEHNELEGKSGNEKQEMLFQKGINWNNFPIGIKRGRTVRKHLLYKGESERTAWEVNDAIEFSKERSILKEWIPIHPA